MKPAMLGVKNMMKKSFFDIDASQLFTFKVKKNAIQQTTNNSKACTLWHLFAACQSA